MEKDFALNEIVIDLMTKTLKDFFFKLNKINYGLGFLRVEGIFFVIIIA